MKNIFKSVALAAIICVLFASCEKKETQVVFLDGKSPVLSTSNVGSSVILTKPQADNPALTLNWTNPSYTLNTGPSSQDVNYAVEMRVKNIGNFVTIDVVNASLTKTFTIGKLNEYLTKSNAEGGINIAVDTIREVEVRITSFIGANYFKDNTTNRSSNLLVFTMNKPYSVIPDLWITGNACPSDWTNTAPTTQKFAYDNVTKNHTITLPLIGGNYYKFLTVSGQWQPQWGVNASTATTVLGQTFTIKENPGNTSDPEAMQAPAVTRSYKITVNLPAKTAKVEL